MSHVNWILIVTTASGWLGASLLWLERRRNNANDLDHQLGEKVDSAIGRNVLKLLAVKDRVDMVIAQAEQATKDLAVSQARVNVLESEITRVERDSAAAVAKIYTTLTTTSDDVDARLGQAMLDMAEQLDRRVDGLPDKMAAIASMHNGL